MRLERLPEYVTVALATALGIGFAIFAGRFAGSGQIGLILMLLGAVGILTVAVTLRTSLWILIPIGWTFEGQIRDLPVPFAVKDLIVGVVFASYCVFIALKIVRVKPKIGVLDLLLFANLLYLAITFLRNPVGVDALGSERVGGRPYFNVFVAVLAYLVLRRVTPTRKELVALPWLVTAANLLIGVLNLIAHLIPWTAPILGRFYTGISQEAYDTENVPGAADSGKQRLNQLSGFGVTTATFLCSLYRPMTLLFPWHPGRFAIFMASMIAVMFSGHRSALLYVMLAFCLASYYRDRIRETIHLGIAGIGLISVLILAQGKIVELPFAVQRTLSWLPGDWNYEAVSDAQASTEWRVQMWKIALHDSTYINNKLLGDGFGFTQWDLGIIAQAESARKMGIPSGLSHQEVALRVGNYHSGPISTLKFVGIVGSVLYYALFIGIAVYAHRLVVRAKGTPHFTTALFLCIPNVYFPFTYIVVFGAFDAGFPITILSLGLLQALGRGLDQASESPLPPSLDQFRLSKPRRSALMR